MDAISNNRRMRDVAYDYGIPALLVIPAWAMLWAYPHVMAGHEEPTEPAPQRPEGAPDPA